MSLTRNDNNTYGQNLLSTREDPIDFNLSEGIIFGRKVFCYIFDINRRLQHRNLKENKIKQLTSC